ncbi:MAG: CPBP family intramembrane metalloprotease [Candidatus Latescibacteria bacterium]|nr:CPBP family intramembrane metalloprotease [Candidatus Latescibacterota bacterium]
MYFYPPPRHILAMVAIVLVVLLIVGHGLGLYSHGLGLLAGEGSILLLTLIMARRYRMPAEDLLLLNATRLPVLGLAVVAAVGASLAIGQLAILFNQVLHYFDSGMPLYFQRELLEVGVARTWPELGWRLVTVGLAPGLCEEIFFRGLIFTGLYVHWGPKLALAGSALLFALVHPSPWQLPALFSFGVFLGLLVYWTHSLYPAVIAHATNNLIYLGEINLRAHTGVAWLADDLSLVTLVGSLLLLVGSLLLLRRYPPLLPLTPAMPNRQPALLAGRHA